MGACARDINASKPAAVLKKWRAYLLQALFIFEVVPNELTMLERAVNLREQVAKESRLTKRSSMQRCFEIAGYKKQAEVAMGRPLMDKDIAAWYADKISLSPDAEKITESLVNQALHISLNSLSEKGPI